MLFRVYNAYHFCRRCLLANKSACCSAHCSSRNSRLFCDDLKEKQNFYEVLGISRTSSAKDIKSAYYKLSFMYHPDKNIGDTEAVKRFHEIGRAYEILGDDEKKEHYDRQLTPRSISDSSEFTGNRVTKVEWLDEDYTAFYKKRRQGGLKRPISVSNSETNYGTYFRAATEEKLRQKKQQEAYDHEEFKPRKVGLLAILLCFGIWLIILLVERFPEEKNSRSK